VNSGETDADETCIASHAHDSFARGFCLNALKKSAGKTAWMQGGGAGRARGVRTADRMRRITAVIPTTASCARNPVIFGMRKRACALKAVASHRTPKCAPKCASTWVAHAEPHHARGDAPGWIILAFQATCPLRPDANKRQRRGISWPSSTGWATVAFSTPLTSNTVLQYSEAKRPPMPPRPQSGRRSSTIRAFQ
jgi:hypothetical protein